MKRILVQCHQDFPSYFLLEGSYFRIIHSGLIYLFFLVCLFILKEKDRKRERERKEERGEEGEEGVGGGRRGQEGAGWGREGSGTHTQ